MQDIFNYNINSICHLTMFQNNDQSYVLHKIISAIWTFTVHIAEIISPFSFLCYSIEKGNKNLVKIVIRRFH